MTATQNSGRRRGSSLNFALVGEGSDTRIFTFASISSLTQSVISTDGDNLGWTCRHCSYENAHGVNPRCPVCGLPKDCAAASIAVEKFRKTGLRGSMAKEMSLSVESLMDADEHEKLKSHSLEKELAMSYANWSISDKDGWVCSACTFVNQNPLHLTCEVCQQQKPKHQGKAKLASPPVLHEFLNASVKSCQDDFLQRQRDLVVQLEERSLEEERMKEIAIMQRELLASILEESKMGTERETKSNDSDETSKLVADSLQEIEEAKCLLEKTQERIKRLESIRQKQKDEQTRMSKLLTQRLMESRRQQDNAKSFLFDSESDGRELLVELEAQQKMLDSWKEQFGDREQQMEELRQQQELLLRKMLVNRNQ